MKDNLVVTHSASEMAALIAAKEVSPVEIVSAYLDRIHRLDSRLYSYITLCEEEALADARRLEASAMRGEIVGPLHGLPLAVKDQFHTKGVLTTGGSTIMKDHVSEEDATVIARAKSAGAILLGKLNMTEFAAGMGDRYKHRGIVRNPWNLRRDAGGSSSGSGAAIAASLCAISLGEDTGGSIRGPSSLNGIVGIRPTWGLVSRYGIIPFSWSLDTGGPMTRTVEDAALVLGAIAGFDPKDPLTSRRPVPNYLEHTDSGLKGLRIGILKELTDSDYVKPEVLGAAEEAASVLRSLGADVEEVSLPLLEHMGAVGAILAESDGATFHRPWLAQRPQDYGPTIRRRILAASLLPSQVVHKAARMRALFRREWLGLFKKYDVLVCPTSPSVAGEISYVGDVDSREKAARLFGNRKSATFPAALAGTPAMSVPCGFSGDGMPIGLQVMAGHFQEATIVRVGREYQRQTQWHRRRPQEEQGG